MANEPASSTDTAAWVAQNMERYIKILMDTIDAYAKGTKTAQSVLNDIISAILAEYLPGEPFALREENEERNGERFVVITAYLSSERQISGARPGAGAASLLVGRQGRTIEAMRAFARTFLKMPDGKPCRFQLSDLKDMPRN